MLPCCPRPSDETENAWSESALYPTTSLSETPLGPAALYVPLKPDVVLGCILQTLFAARIALGGLNTEVPQQELYLLEFASGLVAQTSASPP